MSLENYLLKSNAPAQEIRYAFSEQEVEQLYNLVSTMKFPEYLRFVGENLEDIQKYTAITDSQRKQKKWVNHSKNLLIRMAALQLADATVEFLNDICDIALVVDSGSYRKFHSIISTGLFDKILCNPFFYFPFQEDEYSPNPWKTF
ncbi:hypothetical protein ACUXZJ_07280 [Flavobacterium sp. TN-1]